MCIRDRGYFGYYFSFREWNLYKVYASERKNLVLIEDIYEDTFIILSLIHI